MNALAIALLAIFSASQANAEPVRKKPSGFDKVMRAMFTPRKPAPAQKPKQKRPKPVKPNPSEKPSNKTYVVDSQWMASYWQLEAAWDYAIPEDDQIKWKDGKYIVPLVVFKHYEDMRNTPARASAGSQGTVSPLE